MGKGFSGRTQDSILGTVWTEAHTVDDKVTLCTFCGHEGVTLSASISCTNTAQKWLTHLCKLCEPRLAANAYHWYSSGTAFLRRYVRQG